MQIFIGIMIPFLGTTLGAACVFFLQREMKPRFQKALIGFAAGIMVAASIWSLLLPSIEKSIGAAFLGFWMGTLFLLGLDQCTPHLHLNSSQAEGIKSHLNKLTMMILAVTLHNIPEGMAVGVVYAGWMQNHQISIQAAFVLAIGIAIQNFPEGAIISLPLRAQGQSRKKAFFYAVLTGIVEPIGAIIMLLWASMMLEILPYLLSFAAGAMLYVVIEELIPEMSSGFHSNIGVFFFSIGFSLMMVFDVVFA